MADSYLGQIMLFAGNFTPSGFLPCDGRSLSISQFAGLYSLIGNYYGSATSTTFSLPDLRGRVPVGVGQGTGLQNYTLGSIGGAENVILQVAQMPAHNHNLQAANVGGDTLLPDGTFLASTADNSGSTMNTFNSVLSPVGTLGGASVTPAGSSQGHPNLPPYLVTQWCICVAGIFPTRP